MLLWYPNFDAEHASETTRPPTNRLTARLSGVQREFAGIVEDVFVSSMELTLLFVVVVSIVMLAAATFLPTRNPETDTQIDVDRPSEAVIRADD